MIVKTNDTNNFVLSLEKKTIFLGKQFYACIQYRNYPLQTSMIPTSLIQLLACHFHLISNIRIYILLKYILLINKKIVCIF